MNVHLLKVLPIYYEAVVKGKKRCEVRYNDRDYRVDDILVLWSFDNDFQNRYAICRITHILDDMIYCKKGFVILSIELIDHGGV